MQQNKTPKQNQSFLLESFSRMGTVFLCKCRNRKKNLAKPADSCRQTSVWIDPGGRGCQMCKVWLTSLVLCSYIYFFMHRVDGPRNSSQTHVFSSKLAHISQQTFWWRKIFSTGSASDLQKYPKMKLGNSVLLLVVSPTQGMLTTPNIYILQPKNKLYYIRCR